MTASTPNRPDGHDPATRSEQDKKAIRELLLNAFAALSPETRERVLLGCDDDADNAPEGTNH